MNFNYKLEWQLLIEFFCGDRRRLEVIFVDGLWSDGVLTAAVVFAATIVLTAAVIAIELSVAALQLPFYTSLATVRFTFTFALVPSTSVARSRASFALSKAALNSFGTTVFALWSFAFALEPKLVLMQMNRCGVVLELTACLFLRHSSHATCLRAPAGLNLRSSLYVTYGIVLSVGIRSDAVARVPLLLASEHPGVAQFSRALHR